MRKFALAASVAAIALGAVACADLTKVVGSVTQNIAAADAVAVANHDDVAHACYGSILVLAQDANSGVAVGQALAAQGGQLGAIIQASLDTPVPQLRGFSLSQMCGPLVNRLGMSVQQLVSIVAPGVVLPTVVTAPVPVK
jgi:hypothetical protein